MLESIEYLPFYVLEKHLAQVEFNVSIHVYQNWFVFFLLLIFGIPSTCIALRKRIKIFVLV